MIPVPLRGVEHRAAERVEAVDLGERQPVEHADGTDHDLGLDGVARLERQGPRRKRFVPHGTCNAVAETHVRHDAVLVRHGAHVFEDLGLGAVGLGPIRLDLEGERVERRLDVAFATRVPVQVPCAADTGALFEEDEIVEPLVEQSLAHAETTRTRSDDRNPDVAVAVARRTHVDLPPRAPKPPAVSIVNADYAGQPYLSSSGFPVATTPVVGAKGPSR